MGVSVGLVQWAVCNWYSAGPRFHSEDIKKSLGAPDPRCIRFWDLSRKSRPVILSPNVYWLNHTSLLWNEWNPRTVAKKCDSEWLNQTYIPLYHDISEICIYIYIYTCICIYICVYVNLNIYICKYICCIYIYVVYINMHTYVYVYTCVYTYVYTYVYSYVYIYICIYIYKYLFKCM